MFPSDGGLGVNCCLLVGGIDCGVVVGVRKSPVLSTDLKARRKTIFIPGSVSSKLICPERVQVCMSCQASLAAQVIQCQSSLIASSQVGQFVGMWDCL
jgi:hypothetical protein